MKLETIAVHGGYSPEPTTKAVFCESIDIEHIDDIVADLEQALAAV